MVHKVPWDNYLKDVNICRSHFMDALGIFCGALILNVILSDLTIKECVSLRKSYNDDL